MNITPKFQPDVAAFKSPQASYTASARDLESWMSVKDFIAAMYPFVELSQVASLYGFAHQFSPLYGGRTYNPKQAFRRHHVAEMRDLGIGISLNLTNHFFTPEAYEATLPLLEEHHRDGSSITCFNDELAHHVRRDFPKYELKASIIRGLKTRARLEKMLEIYDRVVLPMDRNDDIAFLEDLHDKERVTIFANASCAYNCPNRTCYVGFSQSNMGKEVTSLCSIPTHEREHLGKVFFDVEQLIQIGFRHFKLVPSRDPQNWAMKRSVMAYEGASRIINGAQARQEKFTFNSYPKSGRSWVRYFLAHYFTKARGLDFAVDLETMFTLFPNDSNDANRGVEALNQPLAAKIPLVVFSHKRSPDAQTSRDILLLRSIPDTLVSEYHHFTSHAGNSEQDLQNFVMGQTKKGVAGLCAYLNAWAGIDTTSGDTLVMTYEALRADPETAFSRILTYLGETLDVDALHAAIEAASFGAMTQAEIETPIPSIQYDATVQDQRRVRRGVVGGFRDEMSEPLFADVATYLDENLEPNAKAFVARHGLMPASYGSE